MATGLNIHHFEFLLIAALWTVLLSAISLVGGGALGAVLALCRISPRRYVRILAGLYIQLIQGTPLLVIIFLGYFGLPAIGFSIPPLPAAGVALSIYVSAYLADIWRSALGSVAKAQWEAAECLALTPTQRMIHVILPQAVRIATPPTVGFVVQLIKNTSLASAVGIVELTRAGQIINNSIFQPFSVYLLVAAQYFAMCYPISILSRRLEKRRGFRGNRTSAVPLQMN
jgi:polar amino acid transport system permease protein